MIAAYPANRKMAPRTSRAAPWPSSALLGQERLDLLARLGDGDDAVDMAVRPRQLPAFNRRAGVRHRFERGLDLRRIEDEIVGRIEGEHRHLDLGRIGGRQLV